MQALTTLMLGRRCIRGRSGARMYSFASDSTHSHFTQFSVDCDGNGHFWSLCIAINFQIYPHHTGYLFNGERGGRARIRRTVIWRTVVILRNFIPWCPPLPMCLMLCKPQMYFHLYGFGSWYRRIVHEKTRRGQETRVVEKRDQIFVPCNVTELFREGWNQLEILNSDWGRVNYC